MTTTRHDLALALTTLLALAACGGSDGTDPTGTGGQGAVGGGGASGGTGGTGGTVETECDPGETRACYEGPTGTEGVGLCVGDIETCAEDGSGWGACVDQVVPATESCTDVGDEDCDGIACSETSWAVALEGMGLMEARDVAVDWQGNAIVVGSTTGELIVGDQTLQTMSDGVVVKIDPAGEVLWVKLATEGSPDPTAVAVDDAGNIYVAGKYRSQAINFGDTPATALEAPGNQDELFTVKLDVDGNHLWSKYLSTHESPGIFGPTGSKTVTDLAVDGGAVYVVGFFNGHFGGFCINGCPFSQGNDGFVRAMNRNNGNHVWERRVSSSGNDRVSVITTAQSDEFYVGGFAGASPLSVGTASSLQTTGTRDGFVARLDSFGSMVWGETLASSANSEVWVTGLDRTTSGLVVSGVFSGEMELGTTLTSPAFGGYVGQLTTDGAAMWGRSYGAPDGSVSETHVAVNSAGYLYLSSFFKTSVTLDGTSFQTVDDAFGAMLSKLDATGTAVWSQAYITGTAEPCFPEGLAVGPDDHARLLIYAEDAVEVGVPVTHGGGWDGIVVSVQP